MPDSFRNHLRPLDDPKIAGSRELDTYEYVERHRQWAPFARAFADWAERFKTDSAFRGVTSNGQVQTGLYDLRPEAAPTAAMVDAAWALLRTLNEAQCQTLKHPLNSRVWRAWMNPEFFLNRFGLRLDEVDEPVREAVLELLRASLGQKGFTKIRHAMWTNTFLGDLTDKPPVFGEFSYNINPFWRAQYDNAVGLEPLWAPGRGQRPCRRRTDGRQPGVPWRGAESHRRGASPRRAVIPGAGPARAGVPSRSAGQRA